MERGRGSSNPDLCTIQKRDQMQRLTNKGEGKKRCSGSNKMGKKWGKKRKWTSERKDERTGKEKKKKGSGEN